MEIYLHISGWLLIALASMHIILPRYFNWKTELPALSLFNRQVMYVHTFFIAFTVFLMGLLCVTSADLLLQTELGNRILLGIGVFWFIRLLIQWGGYSAKLWRGKPFETGVHIAFTALWSYLSGVFLYASLS